MVDADGGENPLFQLVERHGDAIASLSEDLRDISMDVFIIRAIAYGLLQHAKEADLDVKATCLAMHNLLPTELRSKFIARLKEMYNVSIPM